MNDSNIQLMLFLKDVLGSAFVGGLSSLQNCPVVDFLSDQRSASAASHFITGRQSYRRLHKSMGVSNPRCCACYSPNTFRQSTSPVTAWVLLPVRYSSDPILSHILRVTN